MLVAIVVVVNIVSRSVLVIFNKEKRAKRREEKMLSWQEFNWLNNLDLF